MKVRMMKVNQFVNNKASDCRMIYWIIKIKFDAQIRLIDVNQ